MLVTDDLADSTAALADLMRTVHDMARCISPKQMEAATSNLYVHLAPVPFALRVLPLLLQLRDGSKLPNVLAANAPFSAWRLHGSQQLQKCIEFLKSKILLAGGASAREAFLQRVSRQMD